MAQQLEWQIADRVAIRKFFNSVGQEHFVRIVKAANPAKLDATILTDKPDSAVARLAAMKEGWDSAVDFTVNVLASDTATLPPDPGYDGSM